ncbi:O-antigen ligase domain-containing protein [Rhodopseudomonas boonkerdii]|uniref:O-antigen ligase domain-containing protein n=1 Tax=Rhodopseudomonas boonkerdii TaxID=475937 RepID=UPI001E5AC72E|nr:O-antigen ligase domain-containing protein [Rhodopseudomonas boonkerdii]UGV27067.1 O-antigen ligase domain-containing protein [Rhodopseudomonas boonkerdii]
MNQGRLTSRLLGLLFAGWLPAVLLLVVTIAVGPALGSLSRPLFVIGCAIAGWYAWRQSAAAHVQAAIVLFAFAPFVRRFIDVTIGFDQASIMLIGPLIFILMPLPSIWAWLSLTVRPRNPWLVPPVIVLFCVAYAAAVSMLQNDWANAANGVLKWSAPILYAVALQLRARSDGELVNAMAGAFFVVLPITGLYGIWQYVDPPAWDRFWMNYASITSAGYPLPYMVRVFSTMNGPATYGTFTATGLLLVGFLRPSWQSLLAMGPAALGLLLSLYRASWLGLALGLLFCMVFAATRVRAVATGVSIAIAAACAVLFTPFGDVITSRLQSLGSGVEDGSGAERLEEFVTLWNAPDSFVWGSGFTFTDVGVAGAMPIDGQIIASWVVFGIPVGMICLAAYLWLTLWSISAAWRMPTREGVVLGSLALGALVVHMPLTSIASGEIGVLFWMVFAMACPWDQTKSMPEPARSLQRA